MKTSERAFSKAVRAAVSRNAWRLKEDLHAAIRDRLVEIVERTIADSPAGASPEQIEHELASVSALDMLLEPDALVACLHAAAAGRRDARHLEGG